MALRDLHRRALIFVPALIVNALVLIFSRQIWLVRGHSRSGRPGMSFGEGTLLISAIAIGLYFVAPLAAHVRHWAMRAPSEMEQDVAVWFVRAMALAILYGWAVWMIVKFA